MLMCGATPRQPGNGAILRLPPPKPRANRAPHLSGIIAPDRQSGRSSVVEHLVANEKVESSNLFARSSFQASDIRSVAYLRPLFRRLCW